MRRAISTYFARYDVLPLSLTHCSSVIIAQQYLCDIHTKLHSSACSLSSSSTINNINEGQKVNTHAPSSTSSEKTLPPLPPKVPERRSGKTKFFKLSEKIKESVNDEETRCEQPEENKEEEIHANLSSNELFEHTRNSFFIRANKLWRKLNMQNVSSANEALERRRNIVSRRIKEERSRMLVFRNVGMDLDRPILSRDTFLVFKYLFYGKEFAIDNELERMLRYYNEQAMQEIKLITDGKLIRGPATLSRKQAGNKLKSCTPITSDAVKIDNLSSNNMEQLTTNVESTSVSSLSSAASSSFSSSSSSPSWFSRAAPSLQSTSNKQSLLSNSSLPHNVESSRSTLTVDFTTPYFPKVKCAWAYQYCQLVSEIALKTVKETLWKDNKCERDSVLRCVAHYDKLMHTPNSIRSNSANMNNIKSCNDFRECFSINVDKQQIKYNEKDETQFFTLSTLSFRRPAIIIITQSGQGWSQDVEWAWRKLAYETLCPSLLAYFPQNSDNDKEMSKIQNGIRPSVDTKSSSSSHSSVGANSNMDVITLRSVDVSSLHSIHRLHVSRFAKILTDERSIHPTLGAVLASTTFVGTKLLWPFYQVVGLRNYLCPYVLLVDHEGVIRWLSAGMPDETEIRNFPSLLLQLNNDYLRNVRS